MHCYVYSHLIEIYKNKKITLQKNKVPLSTLASHSPKFIYIELSKIVSNLFLTYT